MASSEEYLNFILDQLSDPEEISYRKMMGEYILYCRGKVVGGIYDDRLLLKPTKTALRLMEESDGEIHTDIPYEGAKEMIVADIDNRELTLNVIRGIAEDLPAGRKKK